MIYSFEEFITEKYGYPDSLNFYYKLLYEKCNNLYEKYLKRGGKFANYIETISLNWYDIKDKIDLESFKDCPIEEIECKFSIKLGPYESYLGLANYIKNYVPNGKSYRIHSRSKVVKTAYHISIEAGLIINRDKSSFEIEKFREWFNGTIKHELLHVYQFIKKIKIKKNPEIGLYNTSIYFGDKLPAGKLNNIFYFIYYLSQVEMDANIPVGIKQKFYYVKGIWDKTWNYSEIIQELDEDNIDREKLVKFFQKKYSYECNQSKLTPDPKIINLQNFKQLYDFFCKYLHERWEYFTKKLYKNDYLYHQDLIS